MLKNAYLDGDKEKKTLLQVLDYHSAKFKEKVDKEKRSAGTLKKWYTTKDKLPDIPLVMLLLTHRH